jgi:hypothetical protein
VKRTRQGWLMSVTQAVTDLRLQNGMQKMSPFYIAINRRFMEIQMNANKNFGINLFENEIGEGTKLEYEMLLNSTEYIQTIQKGFDLFFRSIRQSL